MGQPFFDRLRLAQGAFVVLFVGAASAERRACHGPFAVLAILVIVWSVTRAFAQPAPLALP